MRVLHQSRNRESGTTVQALDIRDRSKRALAGLPPRLRREVARQGLGWYVRCVEHHTLHPAATRSWAAKYMAHPTQWCEECKRAGQAKRRNGPAPVREEHVGGERLDVYKVCFHEWAPTADEIVGTLGLPKDEVMKHLRSLQRKGLVEPHRVNGEPPAVWQTYYDVENGGLWEEALADYKRAYA